MRRCEYSHKDLEQADGFGSDGSGKCWITDTANFETADEPHYFCILHAPLGRTPSDGTRWHMAARGVMQSKMLIKLLTEWRNEIMSTEKVGHRPLPFILPGIQTGAVDLDKFRFPATLNLSDSMFFGPVNFRDSFFMEDATLKGSRFYSDFDFSRAMFRGAVDFSRSVFNERACFQESVFKHTADFSNVEFNSDADFSLTEFKQDILLYNIAVTGHTIFAEASILGKVITVTT